MVFRPILKVSQMVKKAVPQAWCIKERTALTVLNMYIHVNSHFEM